MYNGMTGDQIKCDIFFGPNYYMRLKHMVKDKINFRGRGPNTALTRQPVAGRANDGGLRIGEMERDVLISHGMSEFARESMMERADMYYMAVCNTTGALAVYNPAKNIFMSPLADGPINFTLGISDEIKVDRITKFGHEFSVVAVPYSFKLLMQELGTINIQMRIITEDNVAQLSNLSYSDNIAKLTYDKTMTPVKLAKMIKGAMKTRSESEEENGQGIDIPGLNEDDEPEYIEDPKGDAHRELLEWLKEQNGMTNPQSTSNKILDIKKKYQDLGHDISGFAVIDQSEHEDVLRANTSNSNTMMPIKTSGNMQEGEGIGYKSRDLSESFKIDDVVYYVGSTKHGMASSTPWTITKIGNKFITIRCNIPMKNAVDEIQVVSENDIYYPDKIQNYFPSNQRIGEHGMLPNNGVSHMNGMNGGEPSSAGGYGAPAAQPPYSPIIKIFNGNGNDYSTNSGDPSLGGQQPGDMYGGDIGENVHLGRSISPIQHGQGANLPGEIKEIKLREGILGTNEQKEPQSFLGKAANNFSNFLIKKLG